jgi:hypothetical protein
MTPELCMVDPACVGRRFSQPANDNLGLATGKTALANLFEL